MKGLVRKDLKLLAKMDNRIFVIVLYAFAISIAYFGNADIYALQSTLFFSLFLGMHLMMTLTYDGILNSSDPSKIAISCASCIRDTTIDAFPWL